MGKHIAVGEKWGVVTMVFIDYIPTETYELVALNEGFMRGNKGQDAGVSS